MGDGGGGGSKARMTPDSHLRRFLFAAKCFKAAETNYVQNGCCTTSHETLHKDEAERRFQTGVPVML